MKFLLLITFCFVAFVTADSSSGSSSSSNSGGAVQEVEVEAQKKPIQSSVADLTRLRKSAYGGGSSGGYGGGSIPAPPCPKTYIISCQPNLAPVACSSGHSSSYGSVGAYSAPVPTYVTPVRGNLGLPQVYTGSYNPQPYAYNPNNQYYQ